MTIRWHFQHGHWMLWHSLLQNAVLKICSIEWQCVMRKQHEHPSDVPKQLVIWRILLGEHEKNEKNMCSIAWCDQGRWNKYSSINAMVAMVSDLTNPLQLRYVKVASSSPDPVFHFNPAGAGIYLCEQRSVSELKRDGLDIDFHSREILVNARLKCSSMIPIPKIQKRIHD